MTVPARPPRQPPDRFDVFWCPGCGEIEFFPPRKAECGCPKPYDVRNKKRVRYQLARRRPTS